MKYSYKTKGICPSKIIFNLEGDVVRNIAFTGGCNGNLQAISQLAEGLTVEQIESKCKGISCSGRGTSCASQLSTAVRKAYEHSEIKE